MSNNWGNTIKLSIFGESHGKSVGLIIDGLPAGVKLDLALIKKEMARRAPGKHKYSTTRKEDDFFDIQSGFFNGKTTGTPLCIVIKNTNHKSRDYSKLKDILRPGHADFTGYIKYNFNNDFRGGGHFSGRLTAPIVFAGAIAKQLLREEGIAIGSHIYSIRDKKDKSFLDVKLSEDIFKNLSKKVIPTLNEEMESIFKHEISTAQSQLDSVGGIIECAAIGVPIGLGSPFFNSLESNIAQFAFSIPGVKGVEFGMGFDITKKNASEVNDLYYLDNNQIKTRTNNNGGILGGISNGMPIIMKVGIKPTPSIGIEQKTVNIKTMREIKHKTNGRHDPCIVPRALPVMESVMAIVLLDSLLDSKKYS